MYSNGVDCTWEVLQYLFIAVFLFYVLVFSLATGILSRLKHLTLVFIGSILVPTVISLSFFPVIHSLVNLLHQELFSISFWQSDASNGILILRLSSIILTYSLLVNIFNFLRRIHAVGEVRKKRGLNENEIANFTIDLQPNENKQWRHADIATISSLQFILCLISLGVLWYCAIKSNQSFFVSLLNKLSFLLIGIVTIVSDYSDYYGEINKNQHTKKIFALDVALLILAPTAALTTAIDCVTIGFTATMLLVAAGIVFYTKRLQHLHANQHDIRSETQHQ
jgi:hypothetical protein